MFDVILTVRDLHKSFNGYRAVNGVDFSVKPGEVLGLAGPNGSGKSTVLNVISGVLKPDRGLIRFRGSDITGLPPHRAAGLGIARTFQLARPFAGLTVFENVLVARIALKNGIKPRDVERTEELLRLTGLFEKRDWDVSRLSSGALRRLEVARALAAEPVLLLLDEPFATLSVKEETSLLGLLKELNSKGTALFLVSHRPKILRELTRRVLVFESGKIKMEIKAEEIELAAKEGVEL
ncbi:MAG: ATP-binding cassette domain-containing protein [Peptococcaceae bacterium]|nr:ATP-binding cassette domain-containing protein [Peptococcaceae bacterium]